MKNIEKHSRQGRMGVKGCEIRWLTSVLFILLFLPFGYSQSIRKDYREMTAAEKVDLVNAFHQLRNAPDLIDEMRTYHNSNASTIHFNLPDSPETDQFLAWHRMAVFEVEQAMKAINPRISMPFWDSSEDQGVNSPLWDNNFMGSFDEDWGFNRNFGDISLLPTPSQLNALMNTSNWLTFTNTLERDEIHAGAHRWVGGLMRTMASPGDPVFYLHHTWVDKVWKDWEQRHGRTDYILQTLARYDGVYTFGGNTLWRINPNDIIDSRSLGVFYAENGQVILDNYATSNTYMDLEYFYYQYDIEVGNNFLVQSGTNAQIQSVQNIRFLPGFVAEQGADLVASIDLSGREDVLAKSLVGIERVKKPLSEIENVKPFDFEAQRSLLEDIKATPNPFREEIKLLFPGELQGNELTIQCYDLSGRLVYNESVDWQRGMPSYTMRMDDTLPLGVYVLQLYMDNMKIYTAKVMKGN